ncbi:hypothetical protein EV401DRAFT_1896106 [Pisolithus croceorrhizus]|nr:hypothetical protein EV401DRAFT_1896106 [Pisolithus croceorrhizus]
MIHLQVFYWLKQFAEGSILLDMVLDSIEFTLGSNFKSDQWMNLTHCIVMEPDCWPTIEKIFMQELGIVGSSSEAQALPPSVSGIQESSSSTAVPLLKDPSAWHLMMDWAQDKIGFSELDDRMRAYGPCYIPKEWKVLIDKVFMLSDPGVESTSSPSLVVERAMESQGISLSAAPPAPSFRASTQSTSSSQSTTHCCRKSCGVTQNKRHKLNSSIFLDIDAEDEGEEDEGEEEEEDEEGRRNYGPQQVGPLGKGSYLQTIDTLCERFHRGAREATVSNDPLVTQLPTSIFPPPRNNIYIVEFYSASARTFAFEYVKTQGFEVMTLPWLPHRLHKEIVLLPLQEGTSILVYKAQQVLPTRNWVWIKQSAYKGDIGYVKESAESEAVVLVAPRQLPYDLPEESGCNLQELCRVFKIGDTVEVIAGPFCRETGYVVALHEHTLVLIVMQPDKTSDNFTRFQGTKPSQWIGSDGEVWVFMHGKGKGKEDVLADEENPAPSQTVVAMNVSDLRIERPPNTLTFTKDKGYNVAVGDTVEVVRGQWCDSQGIVKAVDLTKASLDIMCPTDRVQINVPITFSRKIMERFEHGLSKFVSRDVWVIAGDKKGSWAMLRTIRRMSCWVGLFGQAIQLKNNQIATPSIGVTPPPSPGPSNAGLSDAWTITPADITQTQTPDYGNVPWLFEPDFCDFKSFHLGFNISIGFTQVSLGKCVVQTNGSAPLGSICVTVTGHNAGLAIQHLTIPAQYLMPANPTGKNQLCLILKGPQAGQVVRIKKCQRASKSVVTEDVFCLNSFDGLMFYQDNYIFLLWNLLWLAPIDDGLEGFTQLSLPFIIVGWRYTNRFAGVLVTPLRCQGDNMAAREGCPIPCDLACTIQSSQGQDLALGSPPNISRTASPVEVTQKCKFCEDRDSALGPPLKISCGTSLTIQTSAINIQPISPVPPVITSLKCKASEDQDLALAHPAKIPPCQLFREITAPRFFALLGFDTPQSNYLSLDDDGCKGLLVWRQTEAFVVPNSLCFSISQMTTDYHLCALRTFFESLTGGKVVPRVHLLLYSWARQTDPFILAPAGKHPRVRMQGIDLLRLGMGKRATGPL